MKYRIDNAIRRNDFLQLLIDASIQEQEKYNKMLQSQFLL